MLPVWKGFLLELAASALPTEEIITQIAAHLRNRGLLDEADIESVLQEVRSRSEGAEERAGVDAIAAARLVARTLLRSIGLPTQEDLERIALEVERLGQRIEELSSGLERKRTPGKGASKTGRSEEL